MYLLVRLCVGLPRKGQGAIVFIETVQLLVQVGVWSHSWGKGNHWAASECHTKMKNTAYFEKHSILWCVFHPCVTLSSFSVSHKDEKDSRICIGVLRTGSWQWVEWSSTLSHLLSRIKSVCAQWAGLPQQSGISWLPYLESFILFMTNKSTRESVALAMKLNPWTNAVGSIKYITNGTWKV